MATRDVAKLAREKYDVLVVGGGITGACIAWDATLRGLRVALVDRDDFGAATSANSLKTVHGGLRYLQDADLGQVRKMVRERQAFLRIAPHLVRPLPCLMPTYRRRLMHGKAVLGVAVRLNDLLSLDRNLGMDSARALPAGRVLDRDECLARFGGVDDPAISGGIVWYDAQMRSTERMLLSFVLSAASRGADVANYVSVTRLLVRGKRVSGAVVEDRLTGESLQIQAHVVVNAAGAWVDEILGNLGAEEPRFHLSAAMNLVTRQVVPDVALAVRSHHGHELADGSTETRSRVLFIAPWRSYSIVGTLHVPYRGRPDDGGVSEQRIAAFLKEINSAYPPARLERCDVHHIHFGFLPSAPGSSDSGKVRLLRSGQLTDHADNGIDGLITSVGVKYTTARYLAERTVDLVFEKLGRLSPRCRTRYQRLLGGGILDWSSFYKHAVRSMMEANTLPRPVAEHLVDCYGSTYSEILSYVAQDPCLSETMGSDSVVTRAEVVHAIRTEMAMRLSDVVRRRTVLGDAEPPKLDVARRCAALMADELGWSEERVEQEVHDLYDEYFVVN